MLCRKTKSRRIGLLSYFTFLGGASSDQASGINARFRTNNAYITGYTSSAEFSQLQVPRRRPWAAASTALSLNSIPPDLRSPTSLTWAAAVRTTRRVAEN